MTTTNRTITSAQHDPTNQDPHQGIVSARGLTKTYGRGDTEVHALAGIDIDIRPGEFTAIMGPSGSGKSTMMHCLAGLDQPTAGNVHVAGTDIARLSDSKLTTFRRDNIGFIFQAFNLIPTLSAEKNILLPLTIAGRKPDMEWFQQVVDTIGLTNRLSHRPSELSGGQQQRVACARALVAKPTIIFADEPTGNLDSHTSKEVLGFLQRSVREMGQTVVMVTHEPSAATYADRVIYLADGRITDDQMRPGTEVILDTITRLIGGAHA